MINSSPVKEEQPKRRRWPSWAAGGSIAMAVLAVIALATTVMVAQRALADASDVVIRGEGDLLVNAVVSDLAEEGPPTAALLDAEVKAHAAEGLRYLAIVERDGDGTLAEAGASKMPDAVVKPGQSTVLGRRVRVTALLFPHRHGANDGPVPGANPILPVPPHLGRHDHPPGPPILVVELEPPVIEKLRADLTRISVVGAAAGTVLLAFAIAWSRSASKLAEAERRAVHAQRLVALGSMSSVMAHELRNPLASLKGHAQLLVEDLPEGKARTKAERVVADAERLELLTTSLLDFVRDGPMDVVSMTPAELVALSLEHLPADRVNVDLTRAPRTLRVDGSRLARAIQNLVENALQATTVPAPVDLRIASSAGDIVIDVRDRGPGLPAGSEAHIFEPFMTTRVRGTGLGLPVARRIAEQHRGTLEARNGDGGGAIFELRFPDTASKA